MAFKKQRKWSSAKESVLLAQVTNSVDVSSWFGKYFRSPQHKTWLEHHSFISILGWSRGLRLIAINADSRINLTNTLGLLCLDDIHLSAAKPSLSSRMDIVPPSPRAASAVPSVLPFAAAAARLDDSDQDDDDFDPTADDVCEVPSSRRSCQVA